MAGEGSVDVIVQVGDAVERIETLPALRGEPEETVTIAFDLGGDHSVVSVTFAASAFLGFVDRLAQFARNLPGPS